jgi:predicted DNA-binding transcriptional regulator YafY
MSDKPRYSRISDILQLLVLMQSKVLGVTLSDIQKEFNVSRRTAERLRDSIIFVLPQIDEIETSGKEKHWGFTSCYMNEIINFTPEEIATLDNIGESLRFKDRKAIIKSIENKIKAFSRKQNYNVEDKIELILKSEGIAVSQKPSYKIDTSIFELVRQAINENKKLKVLYNDKEKILAPYGIIYGSNIYLIGIEGEWTNPYIYKLHKIQKAEITNKTFDKGDFDIQKYANRSFGIYQNNPHSVELLFSKNIAEDVLNYHFHPTQKVKQNDDGSVTVKFKASGELEILRHVFIWGENVKIISPKSLQKQYIELLEKVLQNQKS